MRIVALVTGLLMLLALPSPAAAVTRTVNSLLDTNDGACTATPGGCTLREAIAA